jgi:hypothetical protein
LRYLNILFLIVIPHLLSAQGQTKRVLFLGNSYTNVNNLPQMVADVALSMGDTLIFDSNTPGGYTLQGHSTNTTSLNKIMQGGWDYVVLQEQSQRPSFPLSQVLTDVFPYAQFLDSIINQYNPCAETVFYMTWGRKNGDASNCLNWPPVCTYAGMDSLLNLRYRMMADSNNAIISPVGAVWNYIRQQNPTIELYQPDESHPSVAGTYAGACTFYSVLFRRDPSQITFDATLPPADAAAIRAAAKIVCYDSLSNWHVGQYDPSAGFTHLLTGPDEVTFTNISQNTDSCFWDFGDGNTSATWNPVHTFPAPGTYTVMLVVTSCNVSDTFIVNVNTGLGYYEGASGVHRVSIQPNPVAGVTQVSWNSDPGDDAFTISVIDYTGKIVHVKKGNCNRTELEISQLSEGIYLVRVSTAYRYFIGRFVVQRK